MTTDDRLERISRRLDEAVDSLSSFKSDASEAISDLRLAVSEASGELKTTIAAIIASCRPCHEDVEDLKQVVKGHNGLDKRVVILEQTVATKEKRFDWWALAVVTFICAVVSGVSQWAASLFAKQ